MDPKLIIRQFVEEIINLGRFDQTSKYVHDDVVEQVPFPGQGPGIQGLIDVLRGFRAAFPDLHFAIQEQISEGYTVVTRFEWTGTHRGPFLGIPASGKPLRVWGVVIDRLEYGKLKQTRLIMDALGMMMQMGAMPAPDNARR